MSILKQQRPWYREPYVWLVISFPLAAVIGGIITAVLAVHSDDGLVVDDYYKQGLEINRTLERDNMAADYELSANLQYAEGDKQIRLVINAAANFNYPDKLKVSFLNATRAGLDKEQTFSRSGNNTYLADNPHPEKGKWDILIEGENWRLLTVLNIP